MARSKTNRSHSGTGNKSARNGKRAKSSDSAKVTNYTLSHYWDHDYKQTIYTNILQDKDDVPIDLGDAFDEALKKSFINYYVT